MEKWTASNIFVDSRYTCTITHTCNDGIRILIPKETQIYEYVIVAIYIHGLYDNNNKSIELEGKRFYNFYWVWLACISSGTVSYLLDEIESNASVDVPNWLTAQCTHTNTQWTMI